VQPVIGPPGYGPPLMPYPIMTVMARPRRRRHPSLPGVGWAFLATGVGLAVLLIGGLVIQLAVAAAHSGDGLGEARRVLQRAIMTPHQLFSLLILPLILLRGRCKFTATLNLRRPHVGLLLMMIPLGVLLQVLLGSFLQWFISLLPQEMQRHHVEQARQMFGCATPAAWALTILAVSVSPGLFEEFLFRGVLQSGLQVSPLGRRGALMITAGLFAVVHVSPVSIVPLFAVGLLLGYVCLQTGVIWYGVVLHAAFNFTAIWFANISTSADPLGVYWPTEMLIAAAILLPLFAVPLWIWTRPRRAALIRPEMVDPGLDISLSSAGGAPGSPPELPPRPTLGPIAAACIGLFSLVAAAACFVLTWLRFHPA
jgi:membrane protease YdiL (CAAX protease family)